MNVTRIVATLLVAPLATIALAGPADAAKNARPVICYAKKCPGDVPVTDQPSPFLPSPGPVYPPRWTR